MFGSPLKVGRLFGFAITINKALLVVMVLFSFLIARSYSPLWVGLIIGLASQIVLFGSILLHEIGHSIVARRRGVQIAEIELHIFGGAAKMLGLPKTPGDEILIAAAGPAVSFLLSLLAFVLFVGLHLAGDGLAGTEHLRWGLGFAAYANFVLGVFNLAPALPMDGGRILRAALTPRYGALRATRIAVKVARVVAIGLCGWALYDGWYFLLAVAVFVWILGTRELKMAEMMYGARGGMEVYDRFGRPVSAAPGFGSPRAGSGPVVNDTTPRDLVWSEAPQQIPDDAAIKKLMIVRGPDGRLWVVTER